MAQKPITIDFETDQIEGRPKYPPKPVGVAILVPGKKPQYLAFAHPTKNNATKEQAAAILTDIWKGERPLLFQNARFDLDVAEEHFGLKLPSWERVHDTLYTLFLMDPHSPTLGLKPMAEKYLGMPPEEQDAVKDWLVEHKVIAKNQGHGAFIAKAPGDLVGKYAIGDVVRTLALHEKLYPDLDKKMRVAYDRERRLMPLLLQNERDGVRFDIGRAEQDVPVYEEAIKKADAWLRKRLKVKDLNLDADEDVAGALDEAKVVTDWVWTKGGHGRAPQRSVAKKNMTIERFNDPYVFQVLRYRNAMTTIMGLNLRPWLEMATANKGYVFTSWNQVRGSENGARTGRATCSRFANVPKSFEDKNDGYEHPEKLGVPTLPLVRKYLLPDKGEEWVHLDYSQQEFRIIAHYAEGELLEAYQKDPRTDFHELMQTNLHRIGVDIERRQTKITNFSIKYGSGPGALAGLLHVPVDRAKEIIRGVREATPSVQALDGELKRRGKAGEPIRTWGGRLYYCEPARYVEKYKREMSFEYKLLSYLIQGSGADCIKEALLRYDSVRKHGRLLTTVYDEINISVPPKARKAETKLLREAMESIEFEVPMLTDSEFGPSWGDLKKEE